MLSSRGLTGSLVVIMDTQFVQFESSIFEEVFRRGSIVLRIHQVTNLLRVASRTDPRVYHDWVKSLRAITSEKHLPYFVAKSRYFLDKHSRWYHFISQL